MAVLGLTGNFPIQVWAPAPWKNSNDKSLVETFEEILWEKKILKMTQIDNFGVVRQKTALRALKCFMKKKKKLYK